MILFKKLRDVLIKTRYLVFKLERIEFLAQSENDGAIFLWFSTFMRGELAKGLAMGDPSKRVVCARGAWDAVIRAKGLPQNCQCAQWMPAQLLSRTL